MYQINTSKLHKHPRVYNLIINFIPMYVHCTHETEKSYLCFKIINFRKPQLSELYR